MVCMLWEVMGMIFRVLSDYSDIHACTGTSQYISHEWITGQTQTRMVYCTTI